MKGDSADLVAEVSLNMCALQTGGLALTLLDLELVEARLEHAQRQLAILNLRALVLAGDDDAGGFVAQADGRVSLVEVLTTLAGRAKGIYLKILRANDNLDRIVANVGHDLNLGEGGLAPVRGVE